jgi:hypothetical protein
MFPVRYEHHIHIKTKAAPVTGRGSPYIFPVRYEHHLHIEKLRCPCNRPWRLVGMFRVSNQRTSDLYHVPSTFQNNNQIV